MATREAKVSTSRVVTGTSGWTIVPGGSTDHAAASSSRASGLPAASRISRSPRWGSSLGACAATRSRAAVSSIGPTATGVKRTSASAGAGSSRAVATSEHVIELDPAGHEAEDVGRRPVEPPHVLDHDQRPAGRRPLPHESESGDGDRHDVRHVGVLAAQSPEQCGPQLGGKVVDVPEDGVQELVEAGEGEVRLGRHSGGGQHGAAVGPSLAGERLDEGGLPDPGVPVQQNAGAPPGGRVERRPQAGQLVVAPVEQLVRPHPAIFP